MAPSDNNEWLLRAGAAISSETRESKGQSWLVSRDSSTSLVAQADSEEEQEVPEEFVSPYSTRSSRHPSRAPSARQSRRGSRVGSRPDLTYFAANAGRTPVRSGKDLRSGDDYFGNMRGDGGSEVAGPDFVGLEEEYEDEDEEQRMNEEEVARLTKGSGYGFGSIVDRLVEWTLFEVREDGADADETEDELLSGVGHLDSALPTPKPKAERKPPMVKSAAESSRKAQDDGEGGWKDAAWLLSVASKVIL